MKLFPDERQTIILNILKEDGKVMAADLALRLGATEATIRRDLRQLAQQGRCKRTYGGALLPTPASGTPQMRLAVSADEKQALAQAALQILCPGQLLFLDAGSTHLLLADLLPRDSGLTVVTNSVDIAARLLAKPGIRTIMLGGELNEQVGGAVDIRALEQLAPFRFDVAFIGVCAFEAQSGFGALHYQDAQFKQRLIAHAGSVAVLCSSDKPGRYAPYRFMGAGDVDYLVTLRSAHPEMELEIRQHGGAVLHALPHTGEDAHENRPCRTLDN